MDGLDELSKRFGVTLPKTDTERTIEGLRVSPDEDLAIRTIIGEAKGEGQNGWNAVAGVIRNRSKGGKQSLRDVVLAPNQFEPWLSRKKELESIDPNSRTYQDVARTTLPVLRGEAKDPTGGATHFYSPTAQAALGRKAPSWDNGKGLDIGKHRFFNLGYSGKGKHGNANVDVQAPEPPSVDFTKLSERFLTPQPSDFSELSKRFGVTTDAPVAPSGKRLMLPTDKLATDAQLPPVNPTNVPLKTNATVMPTAEQPVFKTQAEVDAYNAQVDERNRAEQNAYNVLTGIDALETVADAAKIGASGADALKRQEAVNNRYKEEKLRDPSLTTERFNQTLIAEQEAKQSKAKADWLAKNPEFAKWATRQKLDPYDSKTVEAYNQQAPKQRRVAKGQPQLTQQAPQQISLPRQLTTDEKQGIAYSKDIDVSKVKGNKKVFAAKQALQEAGLTPEQANQAVQRLQKEGNVLKGAPTNPNQFRVTLTYDDINWALGGDEKNIIPSVQEMMDVARAQRQAEIPDAVPTITKPDSATERMTEEQMRANAQANLSEEPSFLNSDDISLGLEKILDDPWTLFSGKPPTFTQDERRKVVDDNITELIKSAGSATKAKAIQDEAANMGVLEQGLRTHRDVTDAVKRAPATFARTAAWIEETTQLVRDSGMGVPWVTATDIGDAVSWLTTKASGKQYAPMEQGDLPNLIGDVIEKAFPDDPVTRSTMAGKVARAVGSSAPLLLGAMATGGSSLAVVLLGAAQQSGELYKQAKDAGLSREKKVLAGFVGIPLGASEMVGLKWAKLGELLQQQTKGQFLKSFSKWAIDSGKEMTEEALQEYFQSTSGKLLIEGLKNDGLTKKDVAKALGSSLDDAVTGGIVGLMFGGGVPLVTGNVGADTGASQPIRQSTTDALLKTEVPQKTEPVIEPIKMGAERTAPNPLNVSVPSTQAQDVSPEVENIDTKRDNSGNFEPIVKEEKPQLPRAELEAEIRKSSEEAQKKIEAEKTANVAPKPVPTIQDEPSITDRPTLVADDMEGMATDAKKVLATDKGITYKIDEESGDIFALKNGKEVGFATPLSEDPKQGYDISVAKEFQRQGIGTKLLELYQQANPKAPMGGLTAQGRALVESQTKPKVEPKKTIAKKPLSTIEAKGNKVYNKVEFAPKVKESVSAESETPATGKPYRMVGHHATDQTFDSLDVQQKTRTPSKDLTANGIFFYGDKGDAERLYLKGKNKRIFSEDIAFENPFVFTKFPELYEYTGVDANSPNKAALVTKALKAKGHDGYVKQYQSKQGVDEVVVFDKRQIQSKPTSSPTYSDGTRTGTLETMPNGTQRIRTRPAKAGSPPMDGTTAMSARWKPTSEPMESGMFRSKEEMEASKESFEAAKKLPIEELLAIADPKKITHEDGVIDMADVAEYELVRRVMGNAFGKTGMAAVFQEPSVAQKFIETARDLATQANEAGVDGTKFTELANIVEDATKANGTAIFYIDESDLGEEKAHRSLYMLRQGERATQVPKSDLDTFVAEPIVQKALSGKFGKLYKNKSKAAQMEEFAVKAARGQWGDLDITTDADKRAAAQVAINYLAKFAETNAKEGQTKDQLLKQLAQEIVYGEEARDIQETYESESRPSVQSTENLNQQVADGGAGKTVSGEREEEQSQERVTPVLQSREPGKSGVDFDADEAQQAKERGQKVAAFSRIAGQEIYYDPQSNAETEAQAVQLISDIGTQGAINNALTGKPDAAGMRVVYKEFARLNALYYHHKEQGNDAEAQVVGEYLANLANAIVERQHATGQESQIARTLDVLSPDIAILMAQRRILKARGVGAMLTDEELAETQELGREAQEIEVKLDKERKGLQKSAKKERELADDTKPSKFANTQAQLLKDYRKQKTEIVGKLADLFPDSPLFNGESEAMMSVRDDVSNYENLDPTQIEVLTKYATGEILEGMPYENLIKTIETLGVSPTDAQQIHADAVDIIKPAREPRSPEAKERAKIRREHYKQAKEFNSDGKAFLSGIAQDAALDPRYKDNETLIKAIDFLTNPKNKDKNLNGLITMIRKDGVTSMQDAEQLAHEARKAADTIKAERKEKKDEAEGISKEHRRAINALTVEKRTATAKMNAHLRSLDGNTDYLVKRFNNVMRGAFVSNYFTQLFNAVQAGTVSAPAEMGLDFIAKMMTGIGINVGENTDIDAKDLLMPLAYIVANDKQMAEQALAHFPEEYFRIHSGILGDIQIEKRAQSDAAHPLTKPLHKVFDIADYGLTKLATVTGAKFQEMYFRNAMIAARFDQIIRNRSGQKETLKSALENGTFLNYVTQKDAQKAGDDALEVTYASEINDPLGKKLKQAYDFLDNFVPIFLNPVTYARFTYTVTKGMVLNPLMFGALDAQAAGGRGYNNRSIAKGALGYSGILTAYLLQGMLGGDDDRWDTLYLNGKDKEPISVKRFFPVSGYFYMAHLLRNFKEGGTPPTAKEILEGFASLESDYFTYGAGMELAGALKDYPTANDSKAVTAASARLFGNFVSGLGRFFAPMKAVVAELNEDERALKEYSDSPKDKFISEVSKSIPFISKLSDAKASRDVNGNPILIPFPIGRAVGLNFVHPSLISPKDSPATQWANDKFKFKGQSGTMSAEDRKLYQARKRIKNAWRMGNQIAVDQALKNMMVDLPKGSLDRLKDELKYSELGALVKYNFGMNDKGDIGNLRKVWSKTTSDEKDELRKILKTKKNRTKEFNQEFDIR